MISVCILTKNAERTLQKTLESTKGFSEVCLLDTGSTDQTLLIAKSFTNTKIYTSPFVGFGPLRNHLASLASYDWILALDSDEVLSPALLDEISSLKLKDKTAYGLSRHNYYNGKWIKGCGWYPDWIYRLYHRKETSFSDREVHESLLIKGVNLKKLASPLFHTPYRNTADFLAKMEHYSTLFAKQYQHKRKSSFFKAIYHASFAFLKSYFLKRGVFLGSEGFTISLYNANTAFYKYLKLLEKNQEPCEKKGSPL